MRKNNKFLRNKDGYLSAYGLACGYVDRFELSELSCELYHEGAVYQVRLFDRNKPFLAFNAAESGRFWLSFDDNQLKQARKVYKQLIRAILDKKDYLKIIENNLAI